MSRRNIRDKAIRRSGNSRNESDQGKIDKEFLLDELLEDSIDQNDNDLDRIKVKNTESQGVKAIYKNKRINAEKKTNLNANNKEKKNAGSINLENFDLDKKNKDLKNEVEQISKIVDNDKCSKKMFLSQNNSSKFSKNLSIKKNKKDENAEVYKSSIVVHRNEKLKENLKNIKEINMMINVEKKKIENAEHGSMNIVEMINKLLIEVNKLTLMISNLVLNLSDKFNTKVELDNLDTNVSKEKIEDDVKKKYKDYIDTETWNKMSLYERIMKRFKFCDYRQNIYEDIWNKISKKDRINFLTKKFEWRNKRIEELINGSDWRKINNFFYYKNRTKNGFLVNYDNLLEKNITKNKNEGVLKIKLINAEKNGDIDGFIMYDGEKIYNNGRAYPSIIYLKSKKINPDNFVFTSDDDQSYNDDLIHDSMYDE